MRLVLNLIGVLIAMFVFRTLSFAQWYDPEKVNKKALQQNEKAYGAAMEGRYEDALKHLENALKIDPKFVDAQLTSAGVYANMRNYEKSVQYFKQAFNLDSIYANEFRLPYSISLAGSGQFEEALYQINTFLKIDNLNAQSIKAGNYRKSTYEFALNYTRQYPDVRTQIQPIQLSDSINSTDSEYFPSLTVDGKRMVFTRRLNNYDEDFFVSDHVQGVWQKAVPLEGKVNTNLNEGAQNISQDGTVLVFTGCNYPEGQGSCDIYLSYLKKDGTWSEPENLNFNTEAWESTPSLSPDKTELYFSSNNPGGFGGKDIWVSRKIPGGKWSKPENLGPSVNTDGDESCPFIHADNQTLYFNSNGHPGYGVTDLYMVRKDSTGWSTPINLGYPINSIDDEGSLVVASDGKTGYFSSDRIHTKGGLDIYSIELNTHVRAHTTTWVRGRVFNQKDGTGLPSTVELTDLETGKTVFKLQTDEDGNYLVTLPVNKKYAFNVNRKNYLFYSAHYDIHEPLPDSGFNVNIPLQPLEKGAAIVLNNIFFDINESTLSSASLTELDKVVQLMKENPSLQILIEGHTDNTGNPKDNLTLSLNRAKAVVDYLTSKGVDTKRMKAVGKGDTEPVVSNNSEAEKSRNRRTELHIISVAQ